MVIIDPITPMPEDEERAYALPSGLIRRPRPRPFPRPKPNPGLEAVHGISTIGFIDTPVPETPEPLDFPNGNEEIPEYVPKDLTKSYI